MFMKTALILLFISYFPVYKLYISLQRVQTLHKKCIDIVSPVYVFSDVEFYKRINAHKNNIFNFRLWNYSPVYKLCISLHTNHYRVQTADTIINCPMTVPCLQNSVCGADVNLFIGPRNSKWQLTLHLCFLG